MTFSEVGMVNERHFLNENMCKYLKLKKTFSWLNISVDAKKFYEKEVGDVINRDIEEVDIFFEEEEEDESEEWSWDWLKNNCFLKYIYITLEL